MIPTIEDIVAGLLAGTYTREQAIGWLNEHRKLAALPAPDSVPDNAVDALLFCVEYLEDGFAGTPQGDPQWLKQYRRLVDKLLAARSAR